MARQGMGQRTLVGRPKVAVGRRSSSGRGSARGPAIPGLFAINCASVCEELVDWPAAAVGRRGGAQMLPASRPTSRHPAGVAAAITATVMLPAGHQHMADGRP